MTTLAEKKTVEWFKRNEPFIYRVAVKRAQMDNGLGAMDWGGLLDKIQSTVSNIAPKYLQYKQQKKVMEMQIDRAKQGLPPANVEDYSPVIRIAPTVTPETEQAITRAAITTSENAAKKLLPVLAIGGAAAAFLLLKKR